MTTSNSTDFTQTRDQIITDALCLLGVYGQGDTVTTNDLSFCSNMLNKMIKAWEGQGVHLWTLQEGAIFLTASQQIYDLANTATDIAGDDIVYTTLTASGSGTSLTVSSTTGMNVSDNIGIKLDNNTLQWTTITAIPSTTTITLTASLTSAASSGNNVFVFTTRIDRPIHITSTRFLSSGGFERPIGVRGRDEFMQISSKSQAGKANQYYFSSKVSDAKFYVWPTTDDVGDCLKITYLRRIQDFDSGSNNPDLPQEWLDAITYNLAVRVAPAYGKALSKVNPDLVGLAKESLIEMRLWDGEEGSIRIVPNYRFDD